MHVVLDQRVGLGCTGRARGAKLSSSGKAALLDLMSLDLQDGELLDVNACHKAAWYALEESVTRTRAGRPWLVISR